MAVNLARLKQAAGRYANYVQKMQFADSPEVHAEQARVAQQHREQFLPAAEKEQQVRSTIAATLPAVAVAVETTPVDGNLLVCLRLA